eukprot:5577231-Ditylum_brightwellii.AAC.1
MTTIAKPLKQPGIEYDSKFKHSDLDRVKLAQMCNNGTTKKCPVFTGAEGIEGLLYVEEHFRSVAPVTRSPNQFDRAIKAFYLKYCNMTAKDATFEYLYLVCRPTKVQLRDHSNRIELLVRYSNTLPGLLPDMNNDQVKQMIFDQHPEMWRKFYIQSGKSLETDLLADIVQFMSNKKGFADDDNKKKCKRQQENGNCNKKNKKQKHNQQKGGNRQGDGDKGEWDTYHGVPNSAPCPKHGSHHTSEECKHNPFKRLAQKEKGKQSQYSGRQKQQGQHEGRRYQGPG